MGEVDDQRSARHGMNMDRTDWRDEAACLHADPDLFFPISTTGPALRQVEKAKRICLACPVRTPCLKWALSEDILSGIWGGTTEDERRAVRRAAIASGAEAVLLAPDAVSG